jgi:hypothetical protein
VDVQAVARGPQDMRLQDSELDAVSGGTAVE